MVNWVFSKRGKTSDMKMNDEFNNIFEITLLLKNKLEDFISAERQRKGLLAHKV